MKTEILCLLFSFVLELLMPVDSTYVSIEGKTGMFPYTIYMWFSVFWNMFIECWCINPYKNLKHFGHRQEMTRFFWEQLVLTITFLRYCVYVEHFIVRHTIHYIQHSCEKHLNSQTLNTASLLSKEHYERGSKPCQLSRHSSLPIRAKNAIAAIRI
jgi:hypothetical protein